MVLETGRRRIARIPVAVGPLAPALAGTLVVAAVAGCWLTSLAAGGSHHLSPAWVAVPVSVAAARFGRRGGAASSALAALLTGPLLPADTGLHVPQETVEWVSRALAVVVVGQLVADLHGWVGRLTGELGRARAEQGVERLRSSTLRHQAGHDTLTGLPNRALLRRRVASMLDGCHPRGPGHALLVLDVDDFKSINDGLGHPAGDEVLRQLGERLRRSVRPQDTVARLGGDEYAVVLEAAEPGDAIELSGRILDRLREPFLVAGNDLFVDASIGIAVSTAGCDVDGLLHDADSAMHVAKRGGRGGFALFRPELHTAAVTRVELKQELRRAVEAGELGVAYQPIVAVRSGEIVGVEALARWSSPTRGSVPPDVFVPIAEESGLILSLDAHVLRTACAQAMRWQRAGMRPLPLAVNLSARNLRAAGLRERVRTILEETGMDASGLELEVTESAMLGDEEEAVSALAEIRELGVSLAVDDFGTGYSSLSRLQRLPFTRLKVDRSFTAELLSSCDGAALVQTMIAMAHRLGLEVVAEGVDSPEQVHLLNEYGCEMAQGHLFSRPVGAEAIPELVRRHPRLGAGAVLERFTRPLLEELGRLTGLEATYVTQIHWEREEQEVLYGHPRDGSELEGVRVAWSDTLCRRALGGGPRLTADVPADYPDCDAAARLGLRSYASVPICDAGGRVWGTLCGASTRAVDPGQATLEVMERFAQLIAARLLPVAVGGGDGDGHPSLLPGR